MFASGAKIGQTKAQKEEEFERSREPDVFCLLPDFPPSGSHLSVDCHILTVFAASRQSPLTARRLPFQEIMKGNIYIVIEFVCVRENMKYWKVPGQTWNVYKTTGLEAELEYILQKASVVDFYHLIYPKLQ